MNSAETGEQWQAKGATRIEIDEGSRRLAEVEVANWTGTPATFCTDIRDRIIADHKAAAAAGLPALLDKLEPAWREAYSDPLNLVRVLHQTALMYTEAFHKLAIAEDTAGLLLAALQDALKVGEQADGALHGGTLDTREDWRGDWYAVILLAVEAIAAAEAAGVTPA